MLRGYSASSRLSVQELQTNRWPALVASLIDLLSQWLLAVVRLITATAADL